MHEVIIMGRETKHSSNRIVFLVAYTLFVLSYFVMDIEQNTYDFSTVSSLIRYAALIVGIIGCFVVRKITMNNLKIFLIVFAFGLFSFIFTHSTFFMGVGILSLYAYKINDKEIVALTLKIVLISTIAVILLQFAGVFENVLTKRWLYSNEAGRNSYGFGHSNMLPLIFMYITAYSIIIKKKTIKLGRLLIYALIAILIYIHCDSRNAFFVTLLMCFLVLLNKYFVRSRRLKKVVGFLAKYIVAVCAIFSILASLAITKIPALNQIDFLLSNRLSYSSQMFKKYGVHLVTHIDKEVYLSDSVILDNGYILTTVRYGLVYVIILVIISYFLGKKIQDDVYLSIVMVAISMSNFIDNDLFDYSCLPFMLIAIKATLGSRSLKTLHKKQAILRIN